MLINVTGTIRPQDLEDIVRPLAALLAAEGVESMTSFSVSFLGWRPDARAQIVDRIGFVGSLVFDGDEIIAQGGAEELRLPDGFTIRSRPDELDDTPLALQFGRDD